MNASDTLVWSFGATQKKMMGLVISRISDFLVGEIQNALIHLSSIINQ